MYFDNFCRLCNSVGKTPSAVALEMGLAKTTVSRWKSGSKPNRATLLKVADYFGVSPEYLLDFAGEKEKSPSAEPANGEEAAFLQLFRALTDAEKQSITDQMSWLIERRE